MFTSLIDTDKELILRAMCLALMHPVILDMLDLWYQFLGAHSV